ncbi:MAG: NUDIX hydrolase N-terminal domain-containing protein [Caldilineaceae bacterium]
MNPIPNLNGRSSAERIAQWADKIRDLSATGLTYTDNLYDKTRYETLQQLAIEMVAFATDQPVDAITPLKATLFDRMSPVVTGAAAVINQTGQLLLMRRADNGLWVMPGGQLEVGESPAAGVVRETLEETGIRCVPKVLSGVYDSRIWDQGSVQHVYRFTFLCAPISEQAEPPSHAHETLEIGWFAADDFPTDLHPAHLKRIEDAYRIWKGDGQTFFDW